MKNKVILKKYLLLATIISILLVFIFIILNIYEYKKYTLEYNKKVNSIIVKVKEEYPDIADNQIMEILNSDSLDDTLIKKYGIDINNYSIILENDKYHYKFLLINTAILISTVIILSIVFLLYNKKKDKEINKIIKYIEQINKKNYTLNIDDISEDELSILKNEIYKTTIMLKESAENSFNDKMDLKKSLEDISHQIKTPITSILIILDNLIDDPDMDIDIREEFIHDIKREVVNISFLVQSILKLSKFDSNTINFINDKYLVKDIIDESIKNVGPLIDLKDIKINIYGENNIILLCDFKWQIEAITNIIKNCIEHSINSNLININYSQNKVYTSIIIEDYGEGINKEDMPHIFERFYNGKNSTQDSIGIGLALSKTIIEKNNGNITLESSNNSTKFIIKYYNI